MSDSFLFLGTGASAGIPVIGSNKGASASDSPYDKRLRTSGLLKVRNKFILIDAGPDFRQQALTHHINHLDGVIFTHTHFDHIAGIDDLRIYFFLQHHKLPCLVSKETYEEIKRRYYYLLGPAYENKSMGAQLEFIQLQKEYGDVIFEALPLKYFSYHQSGMKVTGIRYKDFAYVTDIKEYSDEIFTSLEGINTLVISALRRSASPMHFTVDEAIDFARRIGAKQTYFTHISQDLIHEKESQELPQGFFMGYDGLELKI